MTFLLALLSLLKSSQVYSTGHEGRVNAGLGLQTFAHTTLGESRSEPQQGFTLSRSVCVGVHGSLAFAHASWELRLPLVWTGAANEDERRMGLLPMGNHGMLELWAHPSGVKCVHKRPILSKI